MLGPPGGRVAGHADEVLRPPRDAVQEAAILTGFQFLISFGGLLEGEFFGERHHAQQLGVVLLQAGQEQLGEIDRCDLLVPQQRAEREQIEEREIVVVLRAINRFDLRLAEHARPVDRRGDAHGRVELDGRGQAVGHRLLAGRVQGIQAAGECCGHRLAVGFGQGDARDPLGLLHHLRRDGLCHRLGRILALNLRHQTPLERQRPHAQGHQASQQFASIGHGNLLFRSSVYASRRRRCETSFCLELMCLAGMGTPRQNHFIRPEE